MSGLKQDLSEFDPLAYSQTSFGEDGAIREDEFANKNNIIREKNSDVEEDEEPFYDFQLFIQQLRDPRAEPIVRFIKSFLHNFQTMRILWTAQEQSKLINDFKIFIYDKFGIYEPFSELDGSRLRNAQEGLEKLIMGKLYGRCFSPCLKPLEHDLDEDHLQDLRDDGQLKLKSMEYRFVSPKELDIPTSLCDKLYKLVELSGNELNKVNHFKAPRDKMICVLNSCKIIMAMLTNNNLENGADSFIPLLIYTILKDSALSSLVSNARYIERFRFQSFFRGEALYYLNSLQAAISFIISIDQSAFTIRDENNFKQRYDENQRKLVHDNELEVKIKEHNNHPVKPYPYKSPNPSQLILQPLDEAANTIRGKVKEFFSNSIPQQQQQQPQQQPISPSTVLYDDENQDIDRLAQRLQESEQKNTLSTLKSMFPEMDPEIVEDVCTAKRYRVGATVDILLSL